MLQGIPEYFLVSIIIFYKRTHNNTFELVRPASTYIIPHIQISSAKLDDNGLERDNGKRTYGMAEAECLSTGDEWFSSKRLFFSNKKHILDYIAELIPDATTAGAWVGIDNRNAYAQWENRLLVVDIL